MCLNSSKSLSEEHNRWIYVYRSTYVISVKNVTDVDSIKPIANSRRAKLNRISWNSVAWNRISHPMKNGIFMRIIDRFRPNKSGKCRYFVCFFQINRSNSKIVFKPDIIDDIKAPIGKNRIPNDAIHDAWIGVIVIISFWLWSFETPLRAKIRIVGNARKRPLKFGQNCISSRTLDMCIFYNCKSRHIYHIERKAILYCCCQNLWNSKHVRKNSNKFQFILTHLSEISPKTAWFLLTTHLNLLFRNTEGENLFIGLN